MPFKLDFSPFLSIFVDCKVSAWHGFVFPQPSSFLRHNLFSQMNVKYKKKRCQHTNANELICLIIFYLQPFNEKIEQKAVKLKDMMMAVFVCVCVRAKIGKCFKILAYTINAQVQCIQIIMKRKRKERRVNSTIQSNTDTANYVKVG